MTARWSDRLVRLDRAVDRHMSEPIRFVPMSGASDYAAARPDPDRPPFEIDAVLVLMRGEDDLGGNSRQVLNARIVTAGAELHVRPHLLAGRDLRKDDRAEAVETGTIYKIARFDRSHPGRVVIHLSIDGGAE